jgi:hypothetical protein
MLTQDEEKIVRFAEEKIEIFDGCLEIKMFGKIHPW